VFGAIVIPLSCIDLAEQVFVQVAMDILRFVSLSVMIFGTCIAIFVDAKDSQNVTASPPYVTSPSFFHFSGTQPDHLHAAARSHQSE
jgi:hypothetical protein